MADVTMYSTHGCGFCQMAERLLRRSGVERLSKIFVDVEPGQLERMVARTGRRTVPQIFVGSEHVGGFDELAALEKTGQLRQLLVGLPGPPLSADRAPDRKN
jgi:glutaredoxin 3